MTDPVVQHYKQFVDRSLLRENLKLTVQQRFDRFHDFMQGVDALREAGKQARADRDGSDETGRGMAAARNDS